MVILLARMLKDYGYRPAVLSRGYKGKGTSPVNVVSDGKSILLSPLVGGDEPVLIAKSLPGVSVITGPDRYLTGKKAVTSLGADVLILDDGFQHRRLYRDINIVLLDINRPWGNGYLLPRGPLREPAARALQRADILIRTGRVQGSRSGDTVGIKKETEDSWKFPQFNIPVFRGIHQPCGLISWDNRGETAPRYLAGKRICAFAGIGAPEQFRRTLESLGAEIGVFLTYPDHHSYTSSDMESIERAAKKAHAEIIVTTEKDETKLMPLGGRTLSFYSLRIEMNIKPRESFEQLIIKMLKDKDLSTGCFPAGSGSR
jgi:tetraacyldisaccharide 4'-kinase